MRILTLLVLIGWFVILEGVSLLIPEELAGHFLDGQMDAGMNEGEVHLHIELGTHRVSRS